MTSSYFLTRFQFIAGPPGTLAVVRGAVHGRSRECADRSVAGAAAAPARSRRTSRRALRPGCAPELAVLRARSSTKAARPRRDGAAPTPGPTPDARAAPAATGPPRA